MLVWVKLWVEFSMGETGQSTDLERITSGLMHPANRP